jgi:putative ABC transport system permease protein
MCAQKGKLLPKILLTFGELFLSLSFFVILAGILLTILLFALNTASRMQETAIFAALGFTKKQILKIRIIRVNQL